MRFMDAFVDELNKLAATNVAADVAAQYAATPVKQPVYSKNIAADSKVGWMPMSQRKPVSALARPRLTGNLVGGGKLPK